MIYDHLNHIANYRALGPRFAAAIDWLTNTDLAALTFHPAAESGKHKIQIDGDDVYALVMTYPPRAPEKIVWESHRDFADIQVVVAGVEQMGIASLNDDTPVKQAYDAAMEGALYALPGPDVATAETAFLPFTAGMFAIYLPQDIHAPTLALPGYDQPVLKCVIKVRLDRS